MKRFRVFWTNSAKNDLRDIIEYIAEDSVTIAKQKYAELKEAALALSSFPDSGPIVPELERHNITIYRHRLCRRGDCSTRLKPTRSTFWQSSTLVAISRMFFFEGSYVDR
jgi:plasmid stabilization system protein ParE